MRSDKLGVNLRQDKKSNPSLLSDPAFFALYFASRTRREIPTRTLVSAVSSHGPQLYLFLMFCERKNKI